MARGEVVSLLRRVFVDTDKTHAVADDDPNAAWNLGGPGVQIEKDYALALGLREGEDFGAVPDNIAALVEQERRNREAGRQSAASFVQPAPISTATTPDRLTFDRETGDRIVPADLAGAVSPMPQSLEQPHQTPDQQARKQSGEKTEADKVVAGGATEEAEEEGEAPAATKQGGATPVSTRDRQPSETRARTPDDKK